MGVCQIDPLGFLNKTDKIYGAMPLTVPAPVSAGGGFWTWGTGVENTHLQKYSRWDSNPQSPP